MSSRLRFASWVILLGVLSVGGCLPLSPLEVAGGWTGTLTWSGAPVPGMTTPITLTLTQANRTLSGEVGLMGPGSAPFSLSITSGTVDGHTVSIAVSGTLATVSPLAQVSIALSGEGDGTHLSGTGTQTIDGTAYAFTWEAALTAPPPSQEG